MNEIRVSIIVPVFNERDMIENVINELTDFNFSFPIELIIVNDGSSDETPAKLQYFSKRDNIKVINHPNNKGYGASLKSGIKAASGKYVLTFDGDGQFYPEDIIKFYNEIENSDLDVVIGERDNLSSGSPIWRTPGKFFIRLLINNLIGIKLKDFNCGLRIIKREVIIKYLHLCSDKFSFSTTSTMALINRGYNYNFLPIMIRERDKGESTVKLFSGFNTIYLVLKMIMLFNPLKIFFPFGFIFSFLGILWGGYYFIGGRGLSIGALLLILLGFLSVFLGLIADQISELRKSQFEK